MFGSRHTYLRGVYVVQSPCNLLRLRPRNRQVPLVACTPVGHFYRMVDFSCSHVTRLACLCYTEQIGQSLRLVVCGSIVCSLQ